MQIVIETVWYSKANMIFEMKTIFVSPELIHFSWMLQLQLLKIALLWCEFWQFSHISTVTAFCDFLINFTIFI